MINLLLNPTFVWAALAVTAVVTVVLGLMLRRRAGMDRRVAVVIAASGPFALVYWVFHNVVLAVVGFDSVFSALIVVGVACAIGWCAGSWVRRGGGEARKADEDEDEDEEQGEEGGRGKNGSADGTGAHR